MTGFLAFVASPQSADTPIKGNIFARQEADNSITVFTHDGHSKSITLPTGALAEFVTFAGAA